MNRLPKFIAAVAAALALSGGASADAPAKDAKAVAAPKDVTGSWDVRITTPRGAQETTLKIDKAGDKYVGVMTNNRGGTNPVKDVQYKDGDLSFKIVAERQGQSFTIEYSAKVTGDKLKGKMAIAVPGRNLSFPFEGQRAKPESPASGLWKLAFTLESGQKLQPTIQIKQFGDKLSGEYVGITGKKARIKEVTFKDGELSFDAPDQGDHELVFHYAGKLTGDDLKGTVSWKEAGNQTLSVKLEGQKSRTQTADVSGTWKLKVPTKDGSTFEPTLKLTQAGSGVTGKYVGEQGETELTDAIVLGDEFSFEVARKRDGKSFKLRYVGKVNGDKLQGTVDYNFDGMTGFFDFEGQRVEHGPNAAKPAAKAESH